MPKEPSVSPSSVDKPEWTEQERLAALDRYAVLDTPREPLFDDIARLAADVCDAPIAVVNFIADTRQWFKAEVGIGASELPLDASICRHAILQPGLFVVPDLTQDPRFANNPLVTAAGGLRFYAGALLATPEGLPLGTVCVLDTAPRAEGLAERQGRVLTALARQVMTELELRLAEKRLRGSEARSAEQLVELEALYAQAPLGLGLLDRDLRFVRINPALAEINGYAVEEHLGRAVWDLLPELREVAEPPVRRVLETGEPLRDVLISGTTPAQPGAVRHWNEQFYPMKDPRGQVLGIGVICEEVTHKRQSADRLRESEERFRRIADSTPVPMWVTRLDRTRSFVNHAYVNFLGISYEQAVDFDWRQVIHPSDQDRIVAESIAGEASLKPFVLEGRYRRADGKWRWLRSESQPRFGPGGDHIGFIGVAHDITDAKDAEAALRESEARLIMAQRGARAAAWEWDLVERTIRWADPATIQELAGADVPQIISEDDWFARIHPEDVERRREEGVKASAAGAGRATYRVLRGGEVRWLEAVGEVAGRDAEGRPVMLAGITIDITDRKRAEEQLRESETRLRLAVDAADMAIWESDLRTNSLKGSPQLKKLLGFADDEQIDMQAVRRRYYPGEIERVAQASQEALKHPERFAEIELRYCMPDGTLRWLLLRAQAQIATDGTATGFIGVMMDITDRKRAEERQQLLVNELNHRVKNTLAIVQSIAHQSFKTSVVPGERAAFEGRLAALSAAHNLLTRQNWEYASLRQTISDALAAVGPRAAQVTIEGPDLMLPPKTAVSLAMAMHELATNALKYGALSGSDGRAEARWRIEANRLKLVWRERGGPEVRVPNRRGFGTRMIERGLAAELSGNVKIDFEPQGVVCTIDAPLPQVQE